MVKNPPANAGNLRDSGLTPGLGRSPGRVHGNSLQYSCLENPVDRGDWWGHTESDTTERLTPKEVTLRLIYRDFPKRGELTIFCD